MSGSSVRHFQHWQPIVSEFPKWSSCYACESCKSLGLPVTPSFWTHSLDWRGPIKYVSVCPSLFFFFFSIWIFFHEHSRFMGQQGKGEGIYLTPLYHFHLLHRHLDISRAITAESSPLHIAGSQTQTGNLWFPSASR